jgi:threonine dehydrogenase-like Zn-dependent dehydrogenase
MVSMPRIPTPVNAILAISPGGVDYALDAVGAPTTALQILEAVRQGGPRADTKVAWRSSSEFPYPMSRST